MRRVKVEDFDIITLTVTSSANFRVDDSFSKAVNLSYVTVPGILLSEKVTQTRTGYQNIMYGLCSAFFFFN